MSSPWQDVTINGRIYGLSHLQPFTLGVTPKAEGAPTFKVYVSFGSHTFSREWEATDTLPFRLEYNGEVRCFCPSRHAHSLHLPTIIHQGVRGRAYFSPRRSERLRKASAAETSACNHICNSGLKNGKR